MYVLLVFYSDSFNLYVLVIRWNDQTNLISNLGPNFFISNTATSTEECFFISYVFGTNSKSEVLIPYMEIVLSLERGQAETVAACLPNKLVSTQFSNLFSQRIGWAEEIRQDTSCP